MRATINLAIALFVGVVLGVAVAVGSFYYLNRRTTVLTARESVGFQKH